MDAKKILRDLQYRIDSTQENDPERDNAIRVRDRLLSKFNLTLDDIRIARQPKDIKKITRAEAGMLCQFLQKQFGWEGLDQEPHCLNTYHYTGKSTPYSYFIRVMLTEDEAQALMPIALNLLKVYRREMAALEKRLKAEAEKRRLGFNYAFFEKADILKPHSGEEPAGESILDWASVLSAAVALEGIVFPANPLNEEQKQLPSQV